MEWALNDPLKSRAYGHKKEVDLFTKHDKIAHYESIGGHYYPVNQDGKFDEWGAMAKHIDQANKEKIQAQNEEKHKMMSDYNAYLDKQR